MMISGKFQIDIFPTHDEDGVLDSNSVGISITTEIDHPDKISKINIFAGFNPAVVDNDSDLKLQKNKLWTIDGPY